ncbi:arrestin domain-containing protein 1 isoform X2 [Loxodonta africana]|uniref:arrestin domain-containing protein 1 isoform X2 n=1 Tax=Loxodonta africana TaxID=9785 RepID=UPI0030D3A49B
MNGPDGAAEGVALGAQARPYPRLVVGQVGAAQILALGVGKGGCPQHRQSSPSSLRGTLAVLPTLHVWVINPHRHLGGGRTGSRGKQVFQEQLLRHKQHRDQKSQSDGKPFRKAAALSTNRHLPAIRVTCTGSCGVSNKVNDAAWVVEEGYFNSSLSLADKGSLPAGEHTFPFQFLLPATAPTSFEGPFGKIVHQVRATIDTPRFSKDHKCSRVFYILSPLNLNSIPDIEQPNVASATKKFSYKLVKTGSVVLTASTDLRGYVVGQVLRLQVDIENQSGKDTGPVVASLLQVSLKAPEASVTLPVFIGNIAVNHAPLSPLPGPESPMSQVVPSAPPQEEVEAEAVASAPLLMDPIITLSTKSHSQPLPPSPFRAASGVPELCAQVRSPASHPLPPPLCISTGTTVPYFTDGPGGPVPATSTQILLPEYSSWGYPHEAPPSYEQSCSHTDLGLSPQS